MNFFFFLLSSLNRDLQIFCLLFPFRKLICLVSPGSYDADSYSLSFSRVNALYPGLGTIFGAKWSSRMQVRHVIGFLQTSLTYLAILVGVASQGYSSAQYSYQSQKTTTGEWNGYICNVISITAASVLGLNWILGMIWTVIDHILEFGGCRGSSSSCDCDCCDRPMRDCREGFRKGCDCFLGIFDVLCEAPTLTLAPTLLLCTLNFLFPGLGMFFVGLRFRHTKSIALGILYMLLTLTLVLWPLTIGLACVYDVKMFFRYKDDASKPYWQYSREYDEKSKEERKLAKLEEKRLAKSARKERERIEKQRKEMEEMTMKRRKEEEEQRQREEEERKRREEERLRKENDIKLKKEREAKMAALKTKDPLTWSHEDVGLWIETIGLSLYAQNFVDSAIDGEMLMDIRPDQLNKIGFKRAIHVQSFQYSLECLKMYHFPSTLIIPSLVYEWDVPAVCEWLEKLGLAMHKKAFTEGAVVGRLLVELTQDDLDKQLGVKNEFHMRKLLKLIDRLKNDTRNSSGDDTKKMKGMADNNNSGNQQRSALDMLSVNNVCAWLKNLGLSSYSQAFVENAIDGTLLLDISDADLKKLKMVNPFHRRGFFLAIQALGAQNGSNSPLSPLATSSSSSSSSANSPILNVAAFWSVDQVCQWFEKLGLGIYNPQIRTNAIHGSLLLDLTESEIHDILKFKNDFHADKIMRQLGKLRTGMEAPGQMTSGKGKGKGSVSYPDYEGKEGKGKKVVDSDDFSAPPPENPEARSSGSLNSPLLSNEMNSAAFVPPPPSTPSMNPEAAAAEELNSPNAVLCNICCERIIDSVYLECGHRFSCYSCSLKLKDCPLCRRKIDRSIRTF